MSRQLLVIVKRDIERRRAEGETVDGKRADRHISVIPTLISEEPSKSLIFYVMAHLL